MLHLAIWAFAVNFRSLTSTQRSTFAACFLGWLTLDAFDFFLLTVLPLKAIAADFHVRIYPDCRGDLSGLLGNAASGSAYLWHAGGAVRSQAHGDRQ